MNPKFICRLWKLILDTGMHGGKSMGRAGEERTAFGTPRWETQNGSFPHSPWKEPALPLTCLYANLRYFLVPTQSPPSKSQKHCPLLYFKPEALETDPLQLFPAWLCLHSQLWSFPFNPGKKLGYSPGVEGLKHLLVPLGC